MIRVLVVDDSAFMRKALSIMLEEDPEITVAGFARDGLEAIEQVKKLRPDVVTLDIEMPRLDGISAVRRIMKEQPTPVLMVSSLTTEGAQATMDAMQAGAVDFIPKQMSYVSLDFVKVKQDLLAKIKAVGRSRARIYRRASATAAAAPPVVGRGVRKPGARLVAIGVSTGGPFSLQKVVPLLPPEFSAPVVIVQHMPPKFTKSLADRLDGMSPLHVVEAEQGMVLERGCVYIAPGGLHLVFRRQGGRVLIDTPEQPAESLHRPSVDVMFSSAAATFGGSVLAVVMTGMGKDGLLGGKKLKDVGGVMIAQDEESSVVYGMPRAVVEAGVADAVVPLDRIAETISSAVGVVAPARV